MNENSGREVRCIASGFSFLESPRWYSGNFYVSDFYTHRVMSFDERGQMRLVCVVPQQPSGLGFAPDGSLMVVSMKDCRLLRLSNEKLEEVANLSALAPFWCNDMLVDTRGRAYIGNFGWDSRDDPKIRPTRLILVRPDSTVTVVAEDLVFPNGVVLTPDGKTMLVAETFAARISAFDVAADGSLSNRRIWASFSDRLFETLGEALSSRALLPDGMALDVEGNLWVGDAAGRGPSRVGPGGKLLDHVDTGDLTVFAVALGGADRKTLYMCAAQPLLSGSDPESNHESSLLMCRVPVAGTGLP